jgi:pimeloyl-ACP methyl ester carboxylesterase
VIRQLRWYDARLPVDIELHLVGYSLGGVVLFRAASALLAEDVARWRARLASLITVASPHFGTDLGDEGDLLGLFGLDTLLLPGGAVAKELRALGRDPAHRARVEQQAAHLRRAGLRLLTLADEFDTVVTPEDAVIAPSDERSRYVLASARAELGGAYADAVLGHGPLLDNPRAWRLMAEVIGPQEPRGRTATGAIPL